MEKNQKNFKQCDMCRAKEATSLCPKCFSYYCESCFKPVHENEKNKEHQKEKIDYFVPIDTRCSAHERVPINLFCVNEKGNNIIIYNFNIIKNYVVHYVII